MTQWSRRIASLFLTAWFTSAADAQPLVPPAKIPAEALESLVRQYREWGLPEPPANAPPLLLPFAIPSEEGGTSGRDYVLGFRLTEGDGKKDQGSFLVGTEVWKEDEGLKMDGPPLVVDPDKPLVIELHADSVSPPGSFPTDTWLNSAIQCQMRGYPGLAKQILTRGAMHPDHAFTGKGRALSDRFDLDASHFLGRETKAGHPEKVLAASAWNHWLNAAVTTGTDRREAYTHMARLFATDTAFKGKARESLLESLRLAVAPSTAEPGSPEALIDALVDVPECYVRNLLPSGGSNDPHLVQLANMGFAAMPALIEHLDDQRLLRLIVIVPDSPGRYPTHLGETITSLVTSAAGSQLFPPGTRPRAYTYDSSKLARKWWASASRSNEKDYVCTHIFSARKNPSEYDWINDYCLFLVSRRYPQELSGIYERLLRQRPDLDSSSIPEAVAACEGLPREEKLRLLDLGAIHTNLQRREDALGALLSLDAPRAAGLICQEIDRLPEGASPPIGDNDSPEENLASLVSKISASEVWRTFERAARRIGPELRAKWLSHICSEETDTPEHRAQKVVLLRGFFDDPAVWHDKEFPAGKHRQEPKFGRRPDLAHIVGNRAAESLREILKIQDRSDPYWKEEDWKRYRATVADALAREP